MGGSLPSFPAGSVPAEVPHTAGVAERDGDSAKIERFRGHRRGRAVPGRFYVCSACASLDCAVGRRHRPRPLARRRIRRERARPGKRGAGPGSRAAAKDECPAGFSGSPEKGCVDVNECAVSQRRLQPAGDVREHRRLAHVRPLPGGLRRQRLRGMLRRERVPQRRLHQPSADWRRGRAAAGHHDVGERHGRRPRPPRAPSPSSRPRARDKIDGDLPAFCTPASGATVPGWQDDRQLLVVEQPGQAEEHDADGNGHEVARQLAAGSQAKGALDERSRSSSHFRPERLFCVYVVSASFAY